MTRTAPLVCGRSSCRNISYWLFVLPLLGPRPERGETSTSASPVACRCRTRVPLCSNSAFEKFRAARVSLLYGIAQMHPATVSELAVAVRHEHKQGSAKPILPQLVVQCGPGDAQCFAGAGDVAGMARQFGGDERPLVARH